MNAHEDLIRARDLDAGVIADQNVQHIYTISAGLIAGRDIRDG